MISNQSLSICALVSFFLLCEVAGVSSASAFSCTAAGSAASDLVIVLDGSASTGFAGFQAQKDVVRAIVEKIPVGDSAVR